MRRFARVPAKRVDEEAATSVLRRPGHTRHSRAEIRSQHGRSCGGRGILKELIADSGVKKRLLATPATSFVFAAIPDRDRVEALKIGRGREVHAWQTLRGAVAELLP